MARTERLAQPQNFGRYQLLARLAHGRVGDVYKGKSLGVEGFERVLVVKTLNPALATNQLFVDTFVEQAQRAVALAHANVAQVIDLGREETSQTVYMASEFVSGLDLGRLLTTAQDNGGVPLKMAVYICAQIANGLDYAHRRKDFNFNPLNLIHHDLSPQNIMLSTEGDVKITDFGVALAMRHVPSLDVEDELRRAYYAAPEVALGQGIFQQSDLYSLGLMALELFTGTHPYAAQTPEESLRRARSGVRIDVASQPAVPRALVQMLQNILDPNPGARSASAGQVYEELISYIYGNNIQVDSRSLATYIQELKNKESLQFPQNQFASEAGIEEVSISDLQVPESVESFINEDSDLSEATRGALPSYALQHSMFKQQQQSKSEQAKLPGALEEHFQSTRAGQGRCVILCGSFGVGKDHLPDRLRDILELRGNTQAASVQCSPYDAFEPFGVLAQMFLLMLGPHIKGNPEHDLTARAAETLKWLKCDPTHIQWMQLLWASNLPQDVAPEQMTRGLTTLCLHAIGQLCQRSTLVMVLDNVEHMDPLSTDVIRGLIEPIKALPAMIVMSTGRLEETRALFDRGAKTPLHTVKVVGQDPPKFGPIWGALDAQTRDVMTLLALAGAPLSQASIVRMLNRSSDAITQSLRHLLELGCVRVPSAGVFLCAIRDAKSWLVEQDLPLISQHAHLLNRYTLHYPHLLPHMQNAAAMLSLSVLIRNRDSAVELIQQQQQRLKSADMLRITLGWQRFVVDTINHSALGIPHVRARIMCEHATTALMLGRAELCQATLDPLPAMCETIHEEQAKMLAAIKSAELALHEDDLEKAYVILQRVHLSVQSLQDPMLMARALTISALYHSRFGDMVRARAEIERAIHMHTMRTQTEADPQLFSRMLGIAVDILDTMGLKRQMVPHVTRLQKLSGRHTYADVKARALFTKALIATTHQTQMLREAEDTARKAHYFTLATALQRKHTTMMVLSDQPARARLAVELLSQNAPLYGDIYSASRALEMQAYLNAMLGQNVKASTEALQNALKRAQARQIPRDIHRLHRLLERLEAFDPQDPRRPQAAFHAKQAQHIARQMGVGPHS